MLVTESTQKMASIETQGKKLCITPRHERYLFRNNMSQPDRLLDDVLMEDTLLVFFIYAPSLDQTL
ncbi:MAG: hypothetical protein HRT88_05040 [Lentisphaeraceae bacterium]|nr:hypothetical protein [Lentisphaeraceae bacterium]